jgi:putative transcriptional regulator
MKQRVANRLREVRLAQGLTQEQLGKALGVTRHTILALEVGRYVPSIELALTLARFFGRPVEDLFWLAETGEEGEEGEKREKSAHGGQPRL